MRYLMVKFCAILVSLLYYPMCALDEGFCSAGLEGCEGTQRNNNRLSTWDIWTTYQGYTYGEYGISYRTGSLNTDLPWKAIKTKKQHLNT